MITSSMKKLLYITICLLAFASCKKSTTTAPNPPQTWTLNSTIFKVTSCLADSAGASLAATDSFSGNPSCNIVVNFNSSLRTASGWYTVANQGIPPAAGQVSISVGYTAPGVLNNYLCTGGNGTQKVNVTVSNGKIGVVGTGIEMADIGIATDSSALSFNITQTQ